MTNQYEVSIQVKTQINALHYWPDAQGVESYLKYPHMHTFHFTAKAHANHDNRDIEFHYFRSRLLEEVTMMLNVDENGAMTFGARSCEQMAIELMNSWLTEEVYEVQVQEDEECAAVVVKCD